MSTLEELLVEFRADLAAFVQRHAGRLLRYESADDLVQGIHLRALERGASYRHRGREPFLGWMHTVARSHLADRHAYWNALRRRPAALLRLTQAGSDPAAVAEPSLAATGPSTFAARREMLALAVRALALLPARDRDLVTWASEEVPLEEQATRLGLAYKALESARRRALDRYRKTYRLVAGA